MSTNIVVPEMGESIVDARVAKWLKAEGDAVAVGETLVELETDKVDIEVSAPKAGVLAKIAHGTGDDVKIGDVLGTIEEGVAGSLEVRSAPETKPAAAPVAVKRASQPAAPPSPAPHLREPLAPLAASAGELAPAAPRSEERIRMSKRRATIAKRLVEAQSTAAMLTTFNEVDMSAVMTLRERQKQAFKDKYGVSLGIASFFVKASVAALREFPRLNAEIQDDVMVLKHYYDIGVAVGAPEGLVVPVLRDADKMSFADIEHGIRAFAAKAGDGSLTLDDIRGGTFSITNGGVFGSLMSTPILNPPQVGILGLHAIKERPIGVNGQVVLRPMMYTALTYDHRIVDGAEAVQFLVRVKTLVEDPAVLLIGG